MKVLVLGASGATGFQVVKQLLEHQIEVRVIVRNTEKFVSLEKQNTIEIIKASILEISDVKLKDYLNDIDAVISCLGHTISLKGIFGKPHGLVTDAIIKICNAIQSKKASHKIKLLLMNTTACINPEANEKLSKAENVIMTILRTVLPPQKDNEHAVGYLIHTIGKQDKSIEWIAVRPDTLMNGDFVTKYEVYNSPIRSPIFNSGKTSRINVANFMTNLLLNQELWEKWKYMMPVLYNDETGNSPND